MLDLRLRDLWFKTQLRHCTASLSTKTFHPLLNTISTQEDRKMSTHDRNIVDWDVKHQHNKFVSQLFPSIDCLDSSVGRASAFGAGGGMFQYRPHYTKGCKKWY